jgi:acyl-CoA thioesterase FadM
MKFTALPDLRASIWAKSEHEFLKPMKVGSKVYIRGKIIEKYVKRDRNYVVADYETVDEDGGVLMRSRETSVYVE